MLDTFRNVRFIKTMMWIVAFSFIGLIVFEWGADFSGRSAGPIGNTLGIINGKEITYKNFQDMLREASLRPKDAGSADPDEGQLIRQTWNQLVTQILLKQQMDELNISVSDREVNYFNRVQPVEWVRNLEVFQTDAEFDPEKYTEFLNDPGTYSDPQRKQFVLGAESAARQSLRTRRLQERVASSVRITGAQVRQAFRDKHEKVRIAYVGVDARNIPDAQASPSDDEIQKYYTANADEFFQDAAVLAPYVTVPKMPTKEDTLGIRLELERILNEIRGGSEFEQHARNHSEDLGSAQNGGDLGFFRRGQMVEAFEDTAFSLQPGSVSDPFLTRFGWHILKVEEKRGVPDSAEVRARHILLRLRPGRNTLDSLRLAAEEFRDRAQVSGFEAAAREYGFTAASTGFISSGMPFPLLEGRGSALVNAFLEATSGEISPVYETEEGIYVFALETKRDAGPRPQEEVASQIYGKLQTEKKVELAGQKLSAFLQDVKQGKSLKEVADEHGFIYVETQTFSRNDFVPDIGKRNAFVGAAFNLQEGEVSGLVTTSRGAYIIQLLEQTPVDDSEFEAERLELARRLMTQQRNEVFAAWFTNLREQVEIVDNRHHWYNF